MTGTDRDAARRAFADAAGWGNAPETALPADASFRQYYRLNRADGTSTLIMDAPPDKEDVHPYIAVDEHLVSLGLSAPRILARDTEQGFLLLEDFGDGTFTNLFATGEADGPLYDLATDALIALHRAAGVAALDVPPYDMDVLLREALLLPDWLYPALTGHACLPEVRDAYARAWRAVFDSLPPVPDTLVLRDYHVDNLMRLDDRTGAAACGLLDFQDALIGPRAYDLVSLLEDARRDIDVDIIARCRARYSAGMGTLLEDEDAFDRWYRALGAQRHAKVAGIFTRLMKRDGKPKYLIHIPRVVRLLRRHLETAPDLAPVAAWFATHLPTFDAPLPPPSDWG